MMIVVAYDVRTDNSEGARRLRRVAKTCEDYGQRVQNSVFECLVDPAQYIILKNKLLKIINNEEDSLRIYHLGKNWQRRVEHHGRELYFEQEGPIIL